MTLTAFLSIWFLHLLAAVSPGPAVIMSARTGIIHGLATGVWLAVGIGIGGVIWAAAALLGLALLFQAAPGLLWGLKLVGGLYLIWMGWKMWQAADAPLNMSEQAKLPSSARSALLLGIATQLANPKPAVLFSAIFLGTVPASTPIAIYVALLVLVFLNETLWNASVARVFSFDKTRHVYISLKTLIDRAFGGALALLGLKVAAT